MSSGLTNVPTTYQILMNAIFKEQLRKFVSVFFDNILIYSPNFQDHVVHLKLVITTMEENSL